jgi:hypothetical protein
VAAVQHNFIQKQYTSYRERNIHNNIKINIHNNRKLTNLGSAGRAPVFASYTLAFALQPGKEHGKISVRVAQYKNNER